MSWFICTSLYLLGVAFWGAVFEWIDAPLSDPVPLAVMWPVTVPLILGVGIPFVVLAGVACLGIDLTRRMRGGQ